VKLDDLPSAGDRVVLTEIGVPEDAVGFPVDIGESGTVLSVSWNSTGTDDWDYADILVKWDRGRTVSLICPPDRYEIVGESLSGDLEEQLETLERLTEANAQAITRIGRTLESLDERVGAMIATAAARN